MVRLVPTLLSTAANYNYKDKENGTRQNFIHFNDPFVFFFTSPSTANPEHQ